MHSDLIIFDVPHDCISADLGLKLAEESTLLAVSSPHLLHDFLCLLKRLHHSLCLRATLPAASLPLLSVWHRSWASSPALTPTPNYPYDCTIYARYDNYTS